MSEGAVEGGGARVIDGKAIALALREDVRRRAVALAERGVRPGLTVVLVGDDPASQVYVRNKDRAAQAAGFAARTLKLGAQTTQADLLSVVRELDRDACVHGILVQLPLPGGSDLDADAVVRALDPAKDVDGLHPENVAALAMGRPRLVPCTPAGCIELLDRSGVELEGARVVILGRSMLVGRPLAQLALSRNATVTVCHSRTRDLPSVTREADVLVAAVGRAEMVRGDWIRPGAVVVDVGINRLDDGSPRGRLVGDVCYEELRARASAITPVPGGVGPMTIAMLMQNTLTAAARQAGLESLLPQGAGA